MALEPLLFLCLALLPCGLCGWVYYRKEPAVRGRALLAAARMGAVAGAVALLWDPAVPAATGGAPPSRYVILDSSVSMTARTPAGGTLWEEAVERTRTLAKAGARLLLAGAAVTAWDPDSLDMAAPDGARSLLAEAVRVAAEAGAREVALVTDRRLDDPVATYSAARRMGVGVAVEPLAGPGENLGLARLLLPASPRRGETLRGSVEVEGAASVDSVTVTVAVGGGPRTSVRLAAPAAGGVATADFSLGAADAIGAGSHRVTARVEHPDAFSPDDERTAIVRIDPEETGVLLVSFVPDWEPRFLLPVLRQVTGLPVRGFLRTGPGRFHPMAAPPGGGRPEAVDASYLGRLLRRAGMVVAVGADAAALEILEPAAIRRLLLFPRDGAGAAAGGVSAGDPLPGEWYLDEAPPSPIAGETGGFVSGGLPPLTGVLPLLDAGGGVALNVRPGAAGEPASALVLRREGGRRTATALARGFWRWAFRDGAPREHYRTLWAAVGGWLTAGEPPPAGPGVRPAETTAPRGVPVLWRGLGYEGEEVALAVGDSAGGLVLDSAVTVPPDGFFTTPPLPPGRYGYRSSAADTAAGEFEVEAFTGDMLRPEVDPAALTVRADPERASFAGGRSLRTWPLPYLAILAALCAEWAGRRRAGLR